jgi:hypothetical protein
MPRSSGAALSSMQRRSFAGSNMTSRIMSKTVPSKMWVATVELRQRLIVFDRAMPSRACRLQRYAHQSNTLTQRTTPSPHAGNAPWHSAIFKGVTIALYTLNTCG